MEPKPDMYPAMLDTQVLGDDSLQLSSCSHSDGDMFHIYSRLRSADGLFFSFDIYMKDCNYKSGLKSQSYNDNHPLVREHVFLLILKDQNITPRASHSSRPVIDSGAKSQIVKHNMLSQPRQIGNILS